MELRIRPKSDYLHQAGWNELYVLAEHWQSDVKFYHDELKFLHSTVMKYFIWLRDDNNIKEVRVLISEILEHKKRETDLQSMITKHLSHLQELMENPYSHDEQLFRDEHSQLEDQFVDFVKSIRKLKKEVFAITERIIESENLQETLIPKNMYKDETAWEIYS